MISLPGFAHEVTLGVVSGASVTNDFKTTSFSWFGGFLPTGEMTSSTTFLTESTHSRHREIDGFSTV